MARLKKSINDNPERYDRSWESKSRYSMDWYYPVLCGIYDQDKKSIQQIESNGQILLSKEKVVSV